ncbi:MAG: hypothetical protein QOI89_2490 [Solirubrobacteraceae bacterium]|jgi:hypothetical protein|nr:hypothetical protein [Solirubrobacteraceae bacterium]
MQSDEFKADLRAKLTDAGSRHGLARMAKDEAAADLAALVPLAMEWGMTLPEVASLSGLTQERVSELTRQAAAELEGIPPWRR